MIPLGFLLTSTLFIVTLIKSLMSLFNINWDQREFSGRAVLHVFRWPIISFIIMILFISFGVPFLEGHQ